MTDKEIIAGNKIIAEFMGDEIETNYKWVNRKKGVTGLWFHSDWDWLMPVVEKITKIEDGKFSVSISSEGMWVCYINRDDVFDNEIA